MTSEQQEELKQPIETSSTYLVKYAVAVTSPFNAGGLGALLPNSSSFGTVPAVDRVRVDLDPSIFFNATFNPLIYLEAIVCVLVPRCRAAGWTRQTTTAPLTRWTTEWPCNQQFGQWLEVGDNGQLILPSGHQYCLNVMMIGRGSSATPYPAETNFVMAYDAFNSVMRYGTIEREDTGDEVPTGAYNSIPFTRIHKYAENVDSSRVLAGGLRITSRASPLRNGGVVYAGQISQRSLVTLLTTKNGTALDAFVDEMVDRETYRPAEGAVVRYDPLQNRRQRRYVLPKIEHWLSAPFDEEKDVPAIDVIHSRVFTQDQVGAGDYCPMIVWRYDSVSAFSPYSLSIDAIVHLQGRLIGNSPFLGSRCVDTNVEATLALLRDHRHFPIVYPDMEEPLALFKALARSDDGLQFIAKEVSEYLLGAAVSFGSRRYPWYKLPVTTSYDPNNGDSLSVSELRSNKPSLDTSE